MLNIRYRLNDIENSFSNWNPQPLEVPDTEILQLPDHLRRTYLTVASRGECDATVVSNLTGRCRAIESNYLNQLVRMGWLNKRRLSKAMHFRPLSKRENRKDQVASKTISVKHLSTDYDGTISPIEVARCESHVPLETRVLLSQITKPLP